MPKVLKEKILSVDRLAPEIYRMVIESEYVVRNALPGQFVNVKCSEGLNALLRRPISICRIDRSANSFEIIFQVKGTGTEYLSQKKPGSAVDIIAPLGRPFETDQKYKNIAVVGGGIGIFPLYFLLSERKDVQKTAFLGFRNKDAAVMIEEFRHAAGKVLVSTDDGSLGHQGLVVDLLENEVEHQKFDIIFTCGPTPMMKRVMEIAEKNRIQCQVSMEQRMGCGIGACLVCACKTRMGSEWEYSHVCKDGPVFWSHEVILD